MKSLAFYRGSVFLVAFAGILSLAPSQESLAGPVGFLVISGGLWWVRGPARLLPPRGRKGRLAVDLVPAGLFLLSLGLGPTPLEAVVHGSIVLQAFRFFSASRPVHYVEVLGLALGHVVYACSLPPRPLFLLVLLYFALAGVLCLVLFHLVEDSRRRIAALPEGRPPGSDPLERELAQGSGGNRILLFSAGFAAVLLPVAAVLFLLLPRPPSEGPDGGDRKAARRRPARAGAAERPGRNRGPSAPFADAKAHDGPGGADGLPAHPGFAGEIDLGTWGTLFESEREVLAVFPSRAGEPVEPDLDGFYLRGIVFDRFDGRRWTCGSADLRELRDADDGAADGRVSFERFDPAGPGVLALEVQARRELGPVRFHAPLLVGYAGSSAWLDLCGALWARPEGLSELEIEVYRVYAKPPDLAGAAGEALRTSRSTLPDTRYLEVPEGCEAAAALAREAEAPGASPWINAQRFTLLLRGRCSYSRQPYVPPPGTAPLDEFLLRRRAGHCELFASALAVMLRSRGIAARVVGGFRGGDPRVDPMDAPYVAVRESDAHAWVEAWFDAAGWVALDPTPGSGRDVEEGLDGVSGFGPAPEWTDYFVHYGREERNALLGGFSRRGGEAAAGAARRALSSAARLPLPLVAAVAAIAAVVTGALAAVRRRRKEAAEALGRPLRAGELRALAFYARMLQALRKRGFARAPSQTPSEFAAAVTAACGGLEGVIAVTELFERIRYGGIAPAPGEVARAMQAVEAMRREGTGGRGPRAVDRGPAREREQEREQE